MATTTSTSPVVVATEAWPYGMSMDGVTLAARVESNLWTDGVVLASCFGPDERGQHALGSFRGTIERRQSPGFAPVWVLRREDGSEMTRQRVRADAIRMAGNAAINDWATPIRVRLAAISRAERDARRARIAAMVAAQHA